MLAGISRVMFGRAKLLLSLLLPRSRLGRSLALPGLRPLTEGFYAGS